MRLAVVGAVVLMLSGMATAQTPFTIDYTIQMGGDNHEAQYKNEENVAFTPGTTTPPLQDEETMGSVVTWDVIAAASGTDDVGWSIQGIANLVFDVQLQTEAGVPVAPAKFFSTINDGNTDSPRAANAGVAEPFERAAFCLGWDVAMDYRWIDDPPNGNGDHIPDPGEDPALCYFDGTGPAFGPGRLYDPTTVGGPYMDRVQYPSSAKHGGGRMKGGAYFADCNGNLIEDDLEEDGVTDADGNGILDVCEGEGLSLPGTTGQPLSADKLSGMGAGYSQFSASANCLGVGMDVASVLPQWYVYGDEYVGLGIKPVCEGQIDMHGLPTGTYKLVLTVPENANNVVPISYVPGAAGGFAVKADVVNGAEVVFGWKSGVQPVSPIAWRSVRSHTNVGELAIDLVATDGANPTTEPRNGGIQKLVIVFSGSLSGYAPGGVVITGGLSVSGESLSQTTVANDTLTLTVTGSVDKTCYKIDVAGAAANVAGDTTCLVGGLIGDSNNSRSVNTIDMAQVKTKINQAVDATNCRQDLNLSGTINTIDMSLAKSKIPNALGTCP